MTAVSVPLSFVYCGLFNEAFALIAGYPQLRAGQLPSVCVLAAVAVLVQAVVFVHASGIPCFRLSLPP